MVKRIACFLTCGYTEAGTMQSFLKKINNNYEYKQYLPNKTRKKKGDSKTINPSISGLTGDALLTKNYDILEKHKTEISECAAILIEDDLDARFANFSNEEIEKYNENIKTNVCTKLECDIPIFLLYASPEAESWFIADWENGFNYLYRDNGIVNDVETNAKTFFTHNLKQYIEKNVLKEYCNNIEQYGIFNEKYIKLSDQLIKAIQFDSKEYIKQLTGTNKRYVDQIVNSRCLYYSKKLHGDIMLRNILPENVAKGCFNYFRSTYYQLQSFTG